MQILTVDIGTGTQDIFLYDSRLDIENGIKLVVPSPTMIVNKRLKDATRRGQAVLLTGVIMGGGPSAWAAEAHARAGLPIFATAQAAKTFNDDLAAVEASGVRIVGEEEAARLPETVQRLVLQDFDFTAIRQALGQFGVTLDELDAVAVAVFDHGDSPPDYSDRQFRFDYLDTQIRAKNRLSAFAFRAESTPPEMTRLKAVVETAARQVHSVLGDLPLVVMDTAPAAVLGATFDERVAGLERAIIANVGNFHTLAFRLGPGGIEGVFEHHTGFLDQGRLENLLLALADGSLKHADVFEDHGHGALVYQAQPVELSWEGRPQQAGLVVTGPRRSLLRGSRLQPYFAVPFGDMMATGCFGLLAATAEILPEMAEPIWQSLRGRSSGRAPWDV